MVLLLVFMQLTRDLFAIAKFLLSYDADKLSDKQTDGLLSKILPTLTDIDNNNNNVLIIVITILINMTTMLQCC